MIEKIKGENIDFKGELYDLFEDLDYREFEQIYPLIEKILVKINKVKKCKYNIENFVRDIRNMSRENQASAIKRMFGTSTLQSSLAFALLDEEDTTNLEKEIYLS